MTKEKCINCGQEFDMNEQTNFSDFNCSYHPLSPISIGNTGPREDYKEIWVFPCCDKGVVSDSEPSKIPGCLNRFHVSKRSTVFISYGRLDIDFALFLTDELKRRGYTIWRDMENLVLGDDWQEKINEAMNICSHFIFVISNESILRPEVNRELGMALGLNKKIIPILLGDVILDKVPVQIRKHNFIFWKKENGRYGYSVNDNNFSKLDEALADPSRLSFLERIKTGK